MRVVHFKHGTGHVFLQTLGNSESGLTNRWLVPCLITVRIQIVGIGDHGYQFIWVNLTEYGARRTSSSQETNDPTCFKRTSS